MPRDPRGPPAAPAESAHRAHTPAISIVPRPAAAEPARILVVEDEALVARHISNTLARLGYVVVGRSVSAESAIALSREHAPDLVLMDIHLKGERDGVSAAREIRAELGIPVVYLTAQTDGATMRRALGSAAFGYVVKPFVEPQLVAAIESALAQHSTEDRVRRREQEASRKLHADDLTGLLNRAGFARLAEERLASESGPVAMLFADLDGFKGVNDTHGHAAGDMMLREAAGVLSRAFPSPSVVARLGGDEFVVLSVGADAAAARTRVIEALAERNGRLTNAPVLAMSIGVVPAARGDTVSELLSRADAEMYREKRARRSTRP